MAAVKSISLSEAKVVVCLLPHTGEYGISDLICWITVPIKMHRKALITSNLAKDKVFSVVKSIAAILFHTVD